MNSLDEQHSGVDRPNFVTTAIGASLDPLDTAPLLQG